MAVTHTGPGPLVDHVAAHRKGRSPQPVVGPGMAEVDRHPAGLIADLQARAGNGAVVSAVQRRARGAAIRVQRHASWEHALLGDTSLADLQGALASVKRRKWSHVLHDEWTRMKFFEKDASRDPRKAFPQIHWHQLAKSGLWVSYGELNALADYLPDPSTIDRLTDGALTPVLQAMRQGIGDTTGKHLNYYSLEMDGAAWSVMPDAFGGEVMALESATKILGTKSYNSLLARNACHFAPSSWERWEHFHVEARDFAQAFFKSGEKSAGQNVGIDAASNERQAWLTNGYGDHFLQDSFAAGHLINKTLIMQWFLEYISVKLDILRAKRTEDSGYGLTGADRRGLPDDDVLFNMTTTMQPGIGRKDLFDQGSAPTTASGDRLKGKGVTDTETAEDRTTYENRVAGSGVVANASQTQDQAYRTYLKFLNNAFVQYASSAVHDYFSGKGLMVKNGRSGTFAVGFVGGDDTMLSLSGPKGLELVATAAELSRKAIRNLLATGVTDTSVDDIRAYFPRTVICGDSEVPLEKWQDSGVLRDLCWDTIFPEVYGGLKGKGIRTFNPTLKPSGISKDRGK